jgi:hypothetical protein
MPTVQNVAKVNKELQRLGFGTLKDPNLFNQMAMVIRDHTHFRRLLMSVDEGQRHIAYQALAAKLRFKPWPLEDYIIESRTLAEQNQLPHYDPKTLSLKEFEVQNVKTELEAVAEEAIDRDLREGQATQQVELVCKKCTRAQKFRVKSRRTLYKLAAEHGWFIEDKDCFCPKCKPQVTLN